jgi:prefoldin subunit 5
MSDEQMIKDLSIRLRSIEEQLQQLHISVAEIKTSQAGFQKVVSYIGGAALTAVAGILVKLLLN